MHSEDFGCEHNKKFDMPSLFIDAPLDLTDHWLKPEHFRSANLPQLLVLSLLMWFYRESIHLKYSFCWMKYGQDAKAVQRKETQDHFW